MGNVSVRFALMQRVEPFGIHGNREGDRIFWEVSGIRIRGSQPLNFALPTHGATLTYRAFTFPAIMANRLVQFIRLHYLGGVTGYNSFSFMDYMMGWSSQSTFDDRPVNHVGQMVCALELEAHHAYLIRHRDSLAGWRMHSMIALSPDMTLSVLGADRGLIIAYPGELMVRYGARMLQHVTRASFG